MKKNREEFRNQTSGRKVRNMESSVNDESLPCLLVTANVGSVFEDVSIYLSVSQYMNYEYGTPFGKVGGWIGWMYGMIRVQSRLHSISS